MKVQRFSITVTMVAAFLFALLPWTGDIHVVAKGNDNPSNGPPTVSTKDLVVQVPGKAGSGTGFISRINDRSFVVTNIHVLAELKSDTLKNSKGQSFKLPEYGFFSKSRDVALVPIKWNGAALETVMDFSRGSPAANDKVTVWTIGRDGKEHRNQGSIVEILSDRIETTRLFEPVNSGSPLIHDSTKTVLGLVSYMQYANVGQTFLGRGSEPKQKNNFRYFCYRIEDPSGMQKASLAELRRDAKFTYDFDEDNVAYDSVARAVLGDPSGLRNPKHDDERKAVDILQQYSLWDGKRVQTQQTDRLVKLVSDLRKSTNVGRNYLEQESTIKYYRQSLESFVQQRVRTVERIEGYLSARR